MNTQLDMNPQFKKALSLMANPAQNLFITGKAGTGKSTLLEYFCANSHPKPIVLAPTGVAALNAGGQTIHSFFNFYVDITPEKARKIKVQEPETYKNLKTIIIDEISMARADLMDCIDAFLQKHGPLKNKPFGGVQMIFVGDLHQLPPVVMSKERQAFSTLYKTPFFFSSNVFENFKVTIVELEKIYRQKDQDFIDILNRIRTGSVSENDFKMLNKRVQPDFTPKKNEFYIYLTGINQTADEINRKRLQSLPGKTYISVAESTGDFGKEYFPTNEELLFKPKAQIMMLTNDTKRRWVNGSIGVIQSYNEQESCVNILLQDTDQPVSVHPHTWEIYNFSFSKEKKGMVSELAGAFIQYPFKLAWAITIHKSQGKTFDRVIIDMSRGIFASGQAYVALSRCTSLKGLVLQTPIKKHYIRTDFRIFNFLTARHYELAQQTTSVEEKLNQIKQAISEKTLLEITYMKPTGEKSYRIVQPLSAGQKEYSGVQYEGLEAFCLKSKAERMFRIDRILTLKLIGKKNG